MNLLFKYFSAFLLLLSACMLVQAQQTIIHGTVTDAKTNDPLPFVVVQVDGSTIGVTTDGEGRYRLIMTDTSHSTLKVNYIGYKQATRSIRHRTEQLINFRLTEIVNQTQEVVVKAKKGRYRNKDNPAVAFIRKVIDHKADNRKENLDFYEYEKYEKITFAISNITENLKRKKALKNFQFVFDNLDSSKLEGKAVLPYYLKETISDIRYRKSPEAKKEVVKASKMVTFEGFINDEGLGNYLKYLYQDINLYDNYVILLTNQFLSPIAGTAPTFYQFFLADTLMVDSTKCVQVSFMPRSKGDFLFQGNLYIAFDSSYAVKKVDMTVNPNINLNWVNELKIVQEFEKKENQGYVMVKDEMAADFGVSKSKMGFFGQRTNYYKNIELNKARPEEDYKGQPVEILEEAKARSDSFWLQSRHEALSVKEKGIYKTIDSVKTVPAFKRIMKISTLLFAGYQGLGPVEIGPVNTFYSFNPVEGFRLRFGGRTTKEFSSKINFETYAAYGFKDEKLKYYLSSTYSLTKRNIWQFPIKWLKVSYQYDTKIPGQELQFVQEDNFLLSFKRGINDKWLYNDIFLLEHLNEFENHFSFTLGLKYWKQYAAGGIRYNKLDYANSDIPNEAITTTEASLVLRYAPNEMFYQGKVYRTPVITKNPIFTLRIITGLPGVLDAQYNYQNLMFNITKRTYVPVLGITDISLETGKIFGTVPYGLLTIHKANQTYAYQLLSYNLMNFLEFVSDQYASINVDHNFNGLFLNKIPLLKFLKWREFIAVKALYGSVRDENNPAKNPELYKFPVTPDGTPTTYTLSQEPYVEGSVGIGNIFKFFRVDVIKRFTYLDHPYITKIGVRVRFKFDF